MIDSISWGVSLGVLDLSDIPFGSVQFKTAPGGLQRPTVLIDDLIDKYIEVHSNEFHKIKILDCHHNHLNNHELQTFIDQLKRRNIWNRLSNLKLINLNNNYITDLSCLTDTNVYILMKRNKSCIHVGLRMRDKQFFDIYNYYKDYRRLKADRSWIQFLVDIQHDINPSLLDKEHVALNISKELQFLKLVLK